MVPNWPSQSWYPLFKKLMMSEPIFFEPSVNLLSCRKTPSASITLPSCSQIMRTALLKKGYPEDSLETVQRSLSQATLKQYKSSFTAWWKFCGENDMDPFNAQVSQVISFLQYEFNTKHIRYGTFNQHRSALSLILPEDIGSNILIRKFMKGIFRSRPPKPKYSVSWDPQ